MKYKDLVQEARTLKAIFNTSGNTARQRISGDMWVLEKLALQYFNDDYTYDDFNLAKEE